MSPSSMICVFGGLSFCPGWSEGFCAKGNWHFPFLAELLRQVRLRDCLEYPLFSYSISLLQPPFPRKP